MSDEVLEKTVDLSVVVCTCNRAAHVSDCLDSLLDQETDFSYEVVVVDDGSVDETGTVVEAKLGSAEANVVYRAFENGGVNRARNRGLSLASGVYVVFIDDDEIAPPGYLAKVRRLLEERPEFDGVGGPCHEYKSGPGPRTCPNCSLADADVPGEGVRVVDYLLGGNMALRKKVFAEVGPFCDGLSGRGDETEWFHRAYEAEKKFLQDPALWVWHRKDHLSLIGLCAHSFRQGLSVPKAYELQGTEFYPRYGILFRALGHACTRRCSKGLCTAFTELGSLVGFLRLKVGRAS